MSVKFVITEWINWPTEPGYWFRHTKQGTKLIKISALSSTELVSKPYYTVEKFKELHYQNVAARNNHKFAGPFSMPSPLKLEKSQTLVGMILDACKEAHIEQGFLPTRQYSLCRSLEELGEAAKEERLRAEGKPPGKDGYLGESLDTIGTSMQGIYIDNPSITEDELIEIYKPKIRKWIGQILEQKQGMICSSQTTPSTNG